MRTQLSTLNKRPSSTLTGRLVKLAYMGLRERLQEIVDAVGSQTALANLVGVTKSNVSQWLSGDVKSMKAVHALNIQERTGFSALWLVLGKGPKKIGAKEPAVGESKNESGLQKGLTDEEKLLVVIRAFQQSNSRGKDAIWAAANFALRKRAGQKREEGDPSPTHQR